MPAWVGTSGKDDTKPARLPVGKAPPMSSDLEQQFRASQVFSSCSLPSKAALAHGWPLLDEAWGKATRSGWQPFLAVCDRLRSHATAEQGARHVLFAPSAKPASPLASGSLPPPQISHGLNLSFLSL